ncbi:unnamed protein product [Lymnaea stagnalis]|uniref:C-type lectin domain-containing protein n=1 Tax=Lymnaea stagnalis TaxID=6523 RepID=A0AAV2HQJ4_LYMST
MSYYTMLVYMLSVTSLRLRASNTGVSYKFVKIKPNNTGPERLSPGWVDRSRSHCAANCRIRFSSECRSFMYNNVTRLCTPANDLVPGRPGPTVTEGDLYLCDNCQPYPKFVGYENGSTKVAYMYDDDFLTYADATTACNRTNSHLFVPDTLEKVRLFYTIIDASYYTWIGLDDRNAEGKFVWANTGFEIVPRLKNLTFASGQPDNNLDSEDCVHHQPGATGFNDGNCSAVMRFVCEK